MDTVDIDDVSTWTDRLLRRALDVAEELRGKANYVEDLHDAIEYDAEFRSLLQGSRIRAYHATRLMTHEVESIQTQGLRVLSRELVNDRINDAFQHSEIDDEERSALEAAHIFNTNQRTSSREDQVCFFMPRRVLEDDPTVANFLVDWGGEAFSMSAASASLSPKLRRLGLPTIVVAHLDLSSDKHLVSPPIAQLFVGRLLPLARFRAGVHYRDPVAPEDILEIWQPGMEAYDEILELPQA